MADENNTIQNALTIMNKDWSKQIILYGPPGTSKTYSATIIAAKLLGMTDSNGEDDEYKRASEYLEKESAAVRFKLVQFHPAYTYEDFVRGITVKPEGSGLKYEVERKVFEEFCDKAKENNDNFVFMIDEINRAPLSSVLGELIYGLEYRGRPVSTPYKIDHADFFMVPDNVYIIGTMNTADRSIGTIDYAVRRRFAFLPVYPNKGCIKDSWGSDKAGKKAEEYYEKVQKLFQPTANGGFCKDGVNGEDIAIGHTYFLGPKSGFGTEKEMFDYLEFRMNYQVKPILEEYVKDGLLDESLLGELEKENWLAELAAL